MIKYFKKVDKENRMTHYFKVTDRQILHSNSDNLLINSLTKEEFEFTGILLNPGITEIKEEKFETEIRRIIYELEIDQYFKK